MTGALSLDGDGWRMRAFLGDEAAVRGAARDTVLDEPGWLPARVPGSVVDDLWRAGAVPDPYVGLNSRAAEWAADRAWLYATTFDAPKLEDAERAFLRFAGLDYGGDVFLDGERLGRHGSMFAAAEWEVTAQLSGSTDQTHRLVVAIPSAPPSEPQLGRTSRVRVHKSRMTYGWDFCPRLVHQGIWRPVEIAVTPRARILDAWVRPRLEPDGSGAVTVRVDVDTADPRLMVSAVVRDDDGVLGRASAAVAPGTGSASTAQFDVDAGRPPLWWPNGLGAPAVLAVDVGLEEPDGRALDRRTLPAGFRTVELAPNEGAPDGAGRYTLVVNGRRTYLNGWNWVPLDVCYGVPRPGRLDHLLDRARDAGVNLLRVWGGGLIESEAFYAGCDARGILVWQEFSLSSSGFESRPSDDPAFVAALEADARAIVPLRRNQPSLAIWCGGNELEDDTGPLDDVRSPALAAIGRVVHELDPDRAWLPTSPTGPRFSNRLDVIEADPDGLHDVHGPWEHQGLGAQERLYDAGTSLLSSEFGVEGMANARTLDHVVPEANRWPPTRDDAVYRHLGDWWNNADLVQRSFGEALRDLDAIRRASQWLQAEGLRYAVEANRRRWPRNSGTIPWQLNESYPNAWCTSAIDHRGDAKPGYFAVADAYEAVHVCASYATTAWAGRPRIEATVFGWSNAGALPSARVDARFIDLDGAPAARESWTLDLPADGRAVAAGAVVLPLDDGEGEPLLLALELTDADGQRRSAGVVPFSRTHDLAPYLDLPTARLDVTCRERPSDVTEIGVRNVGPVAAVGLAVLDDRPFDAPGWAEPSDGWRHLLPGEEWRVHVRWRDAPTAGRTLRIDGWNLEDRRGLIVA